MELQLKLRIVSYLNHDLVLNSDVKSFSFFSRTRDSLAYDSVLIAGPTLVQNLPSAVQTLCETWNNIHTNEFPNIGSWVSPALWIDLT